MDVDKEQPFQDDNAVAGSFPVEKFCQPRVNEMLILSRTINAPPCKGQIFQRLPKHMRRRQMSHNQSRLPKRLQTGRDNIPVKKRPSRKYRRRRKSLVEKAEVDKVLQLETHVWHAKRFHMINYMAWKLPDRAINKGFRASYRAIRSHCLLMDESYMCCIQIIGPKLKLDSVLQQCFRHQYAMSPNAEYLKKGFQQEKMTIYDPSAPSNERDPIGTVTFYWRENDPSLMLWTHPSIQIAVIKILENALDVKANQPNNTDIILHTKLQFNRFRLIGPMANVVMAKALSIAPISKTYRWLMKYPNEAWEEQNSIFQQFANLTPAMFPPNMIIGLLVNDPRLNPIRPPAEKIILGNKYGLMTEAKQLGFSAIWNYVAREVISKSFVPTSRVNDMKKNCVVPKTLVDEAAAISIQLIHFPGRANGFGAGWDVIIPRGWGDVFWRSFVMSGGRAGGVQDSEKLRLELDGPLSLGQITESSKITQRMDMEQFLDRPPAKRINYKYLGMCMPFSCDWAVLDLPAGTPFVIDNSKILVTLQSAVKERTAVATAAFERYDRAMVPVSIHCKKGRLEDYARIYLPTMDDFDENFNLVEPRHDEDFAQERKNVNDEKRLIEQKARKKLREMKKQGAYIKHSLLIDDLKRRIASYRVKEGKVWLGGARPENIREIIGFLTEGGFSHRLGHCAGQGYVRYTDLVNLLNEFPNRRRNYILCRNTNSAHYLRCEFNVLFDG